MDRYTDALMPHIHTSSTLRTLRQLVPVVALVAVLLYPTAPTAQAPAAPTAQSAAKRAFQPADWYRVKTLSSPAMSPDGRHVAVQVTSVDEAGNDRVSEIWVASTAVDGGEPVRFSAPGFTSTSPRFTPDGTHLVFNSTRPGYQGNQWAVRMDRPGGEFPYTAPAGGGGQQGSSPADGSFTIFTGPASSAGTPQGRGGAPQGRGGGGRQGGGPGGPGGGPVGSAAAGEFAEMPPMARPPSDAVTRPLDPARFDGMHITDLRFKANGRGFVPSTGRAGGGGGGGNTPSAPAQILIDRNDGKGRQPLTDTTYSHRNAAVSPNGQWIAFVADAELRADEAVTVLRESIDKLGTDEERVAARRTQLGSEVYLMPVAGGAPKRITTAGHANAASWSQDSRWLTFSVNGGPFTTSHIHVADAAAGTTRNLTSDLRGDIGNTEWMPDNTMLLSMTLGGRNALFRVDPRTGARTEVVGGARRVFGYTYDDKRTKVAYVATTQEAPTELFVTDLATGTERRLSHFNEEINNTIAWSAAEQFTYTSVDNFEIEAWLMKPFGYEAGKSYPLVLYIHGGPHSAYTEGWFDEFQNITGAGMWVLYTNPRGSSGYGGDFTYSTRGRWGFEDYEDIMKAVDIAAARPDVDENRLGVTGGSYGGFMTAWITTKTDRFKAAQADRMISNWVSWYGVSDAQSLTEGEFFGTPWQEWERYIDLSPIKYADKVKTPTLIVQSEEDHRTPMADAEQWFVALKKHDVPVEFIRYPRSNHDLSRTGEPWLLTDRLHRLRQWFAHYLLE
jgi:dipeptidyl aminopeptidase/acylaminoacyl peptidase